MRARSWVLVALALAALGLLVGRAVTAAYVEHAWYQAMGVPALFWERVTDTVLLQGGAWAAGALFAWANLHAVRRTILAVAIPSRVANIELTAMVPGQRLASATILAALILGGLLALPLGNWSDVALARHGVPFGEIEGILDRDLGFYVYWLPVEETLYLWALVALVTLTALVLVLYALTRSLRLDGRRLSASTHVRRHLTVLGSLVLLLLAWSYRLDAFDLLRQGSGPDGLFVRVDHRVTLRVDLLLAYGSAVAACVLLRTGWVGQVRAAFVTVTLVLVAAVGLRQVAPVLLQRGALLGDPTRRDLDYLASRTLFSRRAFDVDLMRVPTADSARAPRAPVRTLGEQASLWDRTSLAQGLGEGDGGRTRGGDASRSDRLVDAAPVGWTLLDGRVAALAVRRPVASSESWRLYVTDATRPMVRDSLLGPVAPLDDPTRGTWPLVGPGLAGWRVVDGREVPDVPGAPLARLRARVAHAWALRDAALLAVDTVAPLSARLVTHLDVRDRVRRLAPVFVQGADIVPLRAGERLWWVVQLYSASAHYPLSQRWTVDGESYGYFKFAATALVDAATGRVRLIPTARPDPVTRTWMARLPALFTPVSALDAAVVTQLPPATESAVLQARTFARYGSRLDGSVVRHLPDSALAGGAPSVYALAGARASGMGWSLALLGDDDRIAGVLLAAGGEERATWWTPSTAPVRWRAVEDLLERGVDSAEAVIAAPAGRSPRLRRGRITALVTDRGPLYLQAVQWLRGDGTLVIARVGVTDGTRLGLGAGLADALADMGAAPPPRGGPTTPATLREVRDEDAGRLYDAMREAARRGDWTAFGAAFDSLGRALRRPPP
ncbi:MAG: UPF0182 family protein [Gemmatimonadetes bacterium]|nr:UPF0182 family protein [Gemmatimonadota bacterium]